MESDEQEIIGEILDFVYDAAMKPDDQTYDAIWDFINAGSVEEKQGILQEQQALLLNDVADRVFDDLLQLYKDDSDIISMLEQHRAVLHRVRTDTIDAAFADMLQPCPYDDQTYDAVLAFIKAESMEEKQRIVQEQQALLLTDAANCVFNDLLGANLR
jgi:hypothetical protein